MRTVKQSSVAREAEDGEEGEDEAAEFGEEDLFHQQVEAPRRHAHTRTCTRLWALFTRLLWAPPRSRPGSARPQSSQPEAGHGASCPRLPGLLVVWTLGYWPRHPGSGVFKACCISK